MAPFTPFFSEIFYGPLGGAKGSVHLDEWPKTTRIGKKGSAADDKKLAKKLIDQMAAAREFAAAGLAKRVEAGIKVRQPLASITIGAKLEKSFQAIVAEEVNVKKVIYAAKQKEATLDTAITVVLREEGLVREVARMFQELRQKAGLEPKDKIVALMELPEKTMQVIDRNEATFLVDIGATKVEFGQSEKFIAEETTKLEGQEVWVAIRKA